MALIPILNAVQIGVEFHKLILARSVVFSLMDSFVALHSNGVVLVSRILSSFI